MGVEPRLDCTCPRTVTLSLRVAGSRCSPHRLTPSLHATREHTRRAVLRCCLDSDGRRSGALFGAQSGVLNRRVEEGRRHTPLRLPNEDLCPLWPGLAVSVVA